MSAGPETVRIIRVFVSSPGDVQQEREVLDEVVAAINRTDGQASGFRLELFRWEDDVTPQIGPKSQQVVESQTPAYDIYVGIMSTQFGSPAGRYGSGTEREFKNALKQWKVAGSPWITFYFDAQPRLTGDPEQAMQFVKVCQFRTELEKRGLYATYKGVSGSKDSFYEKVSEHLRKIVRVLPSLPPATTEPPHQTVRATSKKAPSSDAEGVGQPEFPDAYIDWLKQQCADIDLLGLKVQHGQAVKLNNVYVPLTTRQEATPGREPDARLERLSNEEDQPVQLLLDLLDKDSLYISGAPGSGKSTFCRWVAWLACERNMPRARIEPPKKYIETLPRSLAGRLPLFVRLRDFWTYLPQTPGCQEMGQGELEESLARWIDKRHDGGLSWDCAESHLRRGSLLLILDGVDEVPLSHGGPKSPCQPRAMLLSALRTAVGSWKQRGNRILLTSRPYGLSESTARHLPLKSAPLGELDSPMRELLVRRWFHCLVDQPAAADATAGEMLEHIAQRQDIEPLTANPMLLTAMCIIYQQGKRLPEDMYDLYDRIVDNVLFNRFPEDREIIDSVRNRLAVVAYGMHTGDGLGEERTAPQAEATYAEVDRMIQTYQDHSPWTEPGYTSAVAAREQLLARTGLFLPHGEHRATFYHFTFQDFLAAQRLLDMHENELFQIFCERAAAPEWHNTLSFVFGSQLAKHSSPQRSILLLGQLVEALAEDTLGLSVVVSNCLHILMLQGKRLKPELEEKFVQYCLSEIEREVPARERLELGLAMGRLGDPRVVTDLRDPAAHVEIPAGEYRIGDDKLHEEGWGLDVQRFQVEAPLLLSRYPVTNSQYAPFVDSGGYRDRQFWSDEGWQWLERETIAAPRFWGNARWNAPNQPVVGVSWWEAQAFARWAGRRLPTEREWEAAASGPDCHKYPWGNEWADGICNSDEAELGVTSPVGIFPRSRSKPFGLEDMAGNVWEWCQDQWRSQGSIRVFRGGCWALVAEYCRSAIRSGAEPEYRYHNLGFRVARSSVQSSREPVTSPA